MEKIRLLWKTMPVEAPSEHKELAFLGTWVSEKLLGKECGFYIHQFPFAEQLVKRVSADGAMRKRETPCEPESYVAKAAETLRGSIQRRKRRLKCIDCSLWLVLLSGFHAELAQIWPMESAWQLLRSQKT